MKKELAFCKTLLTMMFACSLLLTSCGKDEIAPEPTPTPTPTPTPEKKYSGFAFFFTLNSYYGDTVTFKNMVTDSIKKIYPEAKAEGNTISALFVTQNKDSIDALYTQWNKLVKSLLKMDLDQPVVTADISAANIRVDGQLADWAGDISMTKGALVSNIMIPRITNSIFSTSDPKSQPIEKISFSSDRWTLGKGGPVVIFLMNEVVINGNTSTPFTATRLGAELSLYKKDAKTSSYDFRVYPGKKLKLVKVDGDALTEGKQPEYVFESNIKQ